ncbi:MAG: transcriptional regulator NrdR [Defluviitaleaceae bacterium]|nr:transcriptional regulator NrdR [Defluviitaleaceae bacterium]
MKCPFCGELDSKVTDTRLLEDGAVTRRRRLCEACAGRFVTHERLDSLPISVIKRGRQSEIFDRDKILKSVMRSCNKRHVTLPQMEALVADIEATVINSGKKEIESREIGDLVMQRLRELDEVSYVRFASVYKQFRDVDSFMQELAGLISERK